MRCAHKVSTVIAAAVLFISPLAVMAQTAPPTPPDRSGLGTPTTPSAVGAAPPGTSLPGGSAPSPSVPTAPRIEGQGSPVTGLPMTQDECVNGGWKRACLATAAACIGAPGVTR